MTAAYVTFGHHVVVTWQPLALDWDVGVDVRADQLWSESGAQWLTSPRAGLPDRLVRGVAALTKYLDARSAGLAAAVGAGGLGVLSERAALLSIRRSSSVSCGGATRLLPTLDRWIAVTMARPEDIEAIPAWLGVEVDPVSFWAAVERELAQRRSAEVVEQAILLGLPCSGVAEVTDSAAVYRCSLGDAPPRPLAGLVVANLAPLWAGPLAGDVLSLLGARVIKVESATRPDGARRTPPFFEVLNGRCESLVLDLRAEEGRARLASLLQRVDVVIEGSRPRALEQMGIDAEGLTRSGPQVWVSVTGHGRREPHSVRVGFGDDAAAAGGLVGWLDDEPVFLADAIADPLSGLTAAATVVQLLETGGRWLVDVALSRVAASFAQNSATVSTAQAISPRLGANRTGCPLPFGRDSEAIITEFGLG